MMITNIIVLNVYLRNAGKELRDRLARNKGKEKSHIYNVKKDTTAQFQERNANQNQHNTREDLQADFDELNKEGSNLQSGHYMKIC